MGAYPGSLTTEDAVRKEMQARWRAEVAPQWIQRVSWAEATVSVDVTRQAVKDAPPYDSAAQLDRQQEMGIYEHYGRPGYWTTKANRESAADRH
jgi:hypothetical protein